MRLRYVAPGYEPDVGGVETHVGQIARHAAAAGHTVEVVAHTFSHSLPHVENREGVTIRRFPAHRMPTRAFGVAPGVWSYVLSSRIRVDLVHAHGYHALPALGASLGHRPFVFTPHYHGTGHTPVRRILHHPYRHIAAGLFRGAARVICVSEAERALIASTFPDACERTVVIPNGVDTERIRSASPFQVTDPVILCGGRLEGYKGIYRVVAALSHLDPAVNLRIFGQGPEFSGLRRTITGLRLTRRAALLGPISDAELCRWLRTSAVFVTMSRHEAFGITMLQALAAGTPVVASNIPAHREVAGYAPSHVALLSVDAEPATVASAIRAAMQMTPAPRSLLPSWRSVAARTLDVYECVLESSR